MFSNYLNKDSFQEWLKAKDESALVGNPLNGFDCVLCNYLRYCTNTDNFVFGLTLIWNKQYSVFEHLPLWARQFTEITCKTHEYRQITAAEALEALSKVTNNIQSEITYDHFIEYLGDLPDDYQFGSAIDVSNCPLAHFIRETTERQVTVGGYRFHTYIVINDIPYDTIGERFERWATEFQIYLFENQSNGDRVSLELAKEAAEWAKQYVI